MYEEQIEMMEHESADGLDGEREPRTSAAVEELRAQHAGFDRNRNLGSRDFGWRCGHEWALAAKYVALRAYVLTGRMEVVCFPELVDQVADLGIDIEAYCDAFRRAAESVFEQA